MHSRSRSSRNAVTPRAWPYARERRQFGRPIADFQAIQFKLADMETRTAGARELLYQAAAKADRGDADLGKHSAMARAMLRS
jgi:alkylation response protein AidB-like acyl-CoA dehydrogenase